MPSTFNTVALGSWSVAALSKCPAQSVPTLVESAYWKGEHSSSKSFGKCFTNVLPTTRLRVVPVAMPRTPPSFFAMAVNLALITTLAITSGTVASVKLLSASISNSIECVGIVQQHSQVLVWRGPARRRLHTAQQNLPIQCDWTSSSNSNTAGGEERRGPPGKRLVVFCSAFPRMCPRCQGREHL